MPASSWGEPLETFPYTAWAKVLNVNVTGLFHLTRELLPLLESAGSDDDPARIINLGSVMGTQPLADDAYSYTASKAAVHHLTRTLAQRVRRPPHHRQRLCARPFPEPHDGLCHRHRRAGRAGRRARADRPHRPPDDIAGATLYLCSRAGSYVTGAILPIDGGQSVQHGVTLFKE